MAFPYHKKLPLVAVAMLAPLVIAVGPAMAQKKPNVVMLMTDDTGWNDFGAYSGGGARPSATRPRTSTGSPKKGRCSRAGTVRRAARRAALRS